MRHFYKSLLAALLILIVLACKKDDELQSQDPKDPKVVTKQVTESLTGTANLTLFMGSFNNLALTTAEVESGITIFAPLDEAVKVGFISGENLRTTETPVQGLTAEMLRNHIVKGIIKTAGLTDGQILTTLGGKQLKVVVKGSDIWINGVLISGKDVASGAKHVVHTVAELLNDEGSEVKTGIIDVVVWNSAKWMPEKPKGEKEAGVTVSLYNSKEDYALGQVAHTKTTDVDGKAHFENLEAGKKYFIEAKKEGLSNTFYKSAQAVNGAFTGMIADGLFQTQEEVDTHALQPGAAPGNFRWKDLNGDRTINNLDQSTIPYDNVETSGNATATIEVLIGYNDNQAVGPIKSGGVALQLLKDSYQQLNPWQKNIVMLDGILSDDAECGSMTNWCDFDNFTFNPSNAVIASLWQNGYKNIGQLNKILRDVPGLTFAEKEEVIAQARGIRGYIYLQLLTYFGSHLPIQTGLELDQNSTYSSAEDLYSYITSDLQAANSLPASWSSDKKYQLTSGAAKVLLAKAALWKKDYSLAMEYSEQVLQGSGYELAASNTAFYSNASNLEIIWDFSFSVTQAFSTYFNDRSFAPALRLTEVYLINAESKMRLGQDMQAIDAMNIIRGTNSLAFSDSSQDIFSTWQVAMSKEGVRFANLVRWQMAMDMLAAKGAKQYNDVLPVPQSFLMNYPNLVQNPGY